MIEKQNSAGRRAFKLYNKVGATEREKIKAMELIQGEAAENLDEYGRFVRAEIIFWRYNAPLQDKEDAFDTFRTMSFDQNLPVNLIVGACFYAGRCYELGFATGHDFDAALICYRAANKINPKACIKDISRLEKLGLSTISNRNRTVHISAIKGRIWNPLRFTSDERVV